MADHLADVVNPGRFIAGKSGNPNGRPLATTRQNIATLQSAVEHAIRRKIPTAKVIRVVEKLLESAEQGDIKAATALLPYFLTKPSAEESGGQERNQIIIKVENATFQAKKLTEQSPIDGEIIEVKANG